MYFLLLLKYESQYKKVYDKTLLSEILRPLCYPGVINAESDEVKGRMLKPLQIKPHRILCYINLTHFLKNMNIFVKFTPK